MKCNYHSHTWRCGHASGTEREYIEYGLQNRLELLGFSDHSPYVFPDGYYSGFRVKIDQVKDYYRTIGLLREEYEEKAAKGECAPLEILIGYEMEYYPKHFRETLEFMRESEVTLPSGQKAGLQYLILGQHLTGNEYDGAIYSGMPTDREESLAAYVESVTKGMETGCFTYLAHPDLLNFTGDGKIYEKHMRELVKAAEKYDVPLEINLLGLHEHRSYPRDLFWNIVRESCCRVVLGCDAHQPERVGNPVLIEEGEAFAKRFGLKLTDRLELRDPFRILD